MPVRTPTTANSRCMRCSEGRVLRAMQEPGQRWCAPCVDAYARICERCSNPTALAVLRPVGVGEIVCPQCVVALGEHECSNCHVAAREVLNVNGGQFCPSCCLRCPRCNNWATETREVRGDGVEQWCPDCVGRSATTCRRRGCGQVHPTAYACQVIEIYEYNYKPEPKFNGKGPVFYGLELEMEYGPDGKNIIKNVPGQYWYFKHDGSVSNGVELVTEPFDYTYWLKNKEVLTAVLKDYSKRGVRSWDTTTCGLHIHVSRTALQGELHLMKLLNWAHFNPGLVLKFSRRKPADLNQWANPSHGGFSAVEILKQERNNGRGGERRSDNRRRAINTCPAHTIEFRMFKGTIGVDGIQTNLDFVRALLQYTQDAPIDDMNYGERFVKWLDKRRGEYKHLTDWMCGANMLEKPKAAKGVR